MKAIICTGHGDVHIHSFTQEWTACLCGNVKARWEDPQAGTVVVTTRVPAGRDRVRLLGLNNQLLLPAVTARGQMWEDFRAWHEQATDAPGYIFDKSRAACWAVSSRASGPRVTCGGPPMTSTPKRGQRKPRCVILRAVPRDG